MANGSTFNAIADELIQKKQREGLQPKTIERLRSLVKLAAPHIGERPVAEITSAEVLIVLQAVERRGTFVTAVKLRAFAGEVFRFAVATSRATNDPCAALREALTSPATIHRVAIVEPKAFGGLLRSIHAYEGAIETRIALELCALLAPRPGELRGAEWSEINFDDRIWQIPKHKMKMRREHRIYLAPQAIELLQELHAITGHRRFLFPNVRSREGVMSSNTLSGALARLGFDGVHSAHGFRSSFSSMANESGLWNADAIEAALAHQHQNSTRRAYQRSDFWEERVRMMAWWADRCDEMRAAAPSTKAA
ncbi:MAG: site-specific integrase [Alphaproteobacteria bacterium]|nr:site-specific integrase [Alphaproteobacteria bacterium]